MRRTGGSFQPWSWCDRCGFLYPLGMLQVQKGLKVCTLYCLDNLDIEYRPYIITQVLSTGDEEGMPKTPELYQDPELLTF